jgi:DNA-3-methyladenine glycosylase
VDSELLQCLEKQALPASFYARPTLEIAKELLGKALVCHLSDGITAGLIVETEGYVGQDDPACHAYKGLTARNRTMWGNPGHAYVYFTYGNHWMFNVVTEREGYPAAVLVRALQPLLGLELMRQRRNLEDLKGNKDDRHLCNGPGKLCRALGINGALNGFSLDSPELFVAQVPPEIALTPFQMVHSTRIGISRGIDLPWRFYVAANRHVSKY